MSKAQKFFWLIFGLYFVMTEVATLVSDYYQNDLGFLINMKGYIPLMKYFALLGLALYTTSYVMMRLSEKNRIKQEGYLKGEKRELKAKLFDLQEKYNNLKETATTPTTNISETKSEKPL
jgi:hypothetical protein